MATGFIKWFQDFCTNCTYAYNFLLSTPFKDLTGAPESIQNLNFLELIGFGGLAVFIGIAIVKWLLI